MPAESTVEKVSSVPGAGKVAVPRDPSPEEMSTDFSLPPEFSHSDTEVADPKPIAKEALETPKVEKAVETPRTEDKPVRQKTVEDKLVAAAHEIKPIMPLSALPKERNYEGFSSEEVQALKAMSNDAFALTSSLIKEKKELSKLKDASYLQHPFAYTLSPEFTKLQEDSYYLNAEGQYWRQQAINIAEGKEWAELKGWDTKGNPVMGPVQKPTTEAGKDADRLSLQLFTKAQGTQEQVQQFSGRFQQQIATDNQLIQQECAKRFGWVADPSLLDAKVSNPGYGEKTIRQIRDDYTALFPVYHRNSVGVQVGANLFAALQIYGQRIHELENNKQVAAVKEEEKALIEPTSKERPASKNGSAKGMGGWEVKEFSLEGLPQ
jgi:hypothetical protein